MKLEDLVEAPAKKLGGVKSGVKLEVQPYMYQTKEEIEAWMERCHVQGMVSRELTIHPTSDVDLSRYGLKREDALIHHKGKWVLPVQFHFCKSFDVANVELGSLVGLPYLVMENLKIDYSKLNNFRGMPQVMKKLEGGSAVKIKSFDGLQENSCDYFYWKCSAGIESLDGLPSKVKKLSLRVYNDTVLDIQNILQQCPNAEEIGFRCEDGSTFKNLLSSVFKREKRFDYIWFSHSKYSNAQNKDVMTVIQTHYDENKSAAQCQTALFKAGFKEFCR